MNRKCILMFFSMLPAMIVGAQGNVSGCPGFKNPTSFDTGDTGFFWTARVGERIYPQVEVGGTVSGSHDTTTGNYIMSSCAAPNAPDILGDANITSPAYNSPSDEGLQCCDDYSLFDANGRRFQIITQEHAGYDEFTINFDSVGMPRVPEGYETSIRLGDPRAAGSHQTPHFWLTSRPNLGAEALFYTMRVTNENSLLIINYAVVGRCYSHTVAEAGEFLIRVVGLNADGTWANEPLNDSLWFKVSAPPIGGGHTLEPWVNGRPGGSCSSTTCAYVYKPWARAAISLDRYLGSKVRIEMYTSDCIYDWDPIYAYITGDYQSMTIRSSGCPMSESGVVDTLKAPEGMLSYQWFVSTTGVDCEECDTSVVNALNYVQVWPTTPGTVTTGNVYCPDLHDFRTMEGPSLGDTVLRKVFKCVMTSALDPNKPFSSRLYVTVTNRRPVMGYSTAQHCDSSVTFFNHSYTMLSSGLDPTETKWIIYENIGDTVALDTIWGDTATYAFPHIGRYWVKLYCSTAGESCPATQSFSVNVTELPEVAFTLDNDHLCDGDEAVFRCTRGCDMQKVWVVDSTEYPPAEGDLMNEFKVRLRTGQHKVTMKVKTTQMCEMEVSDTVEVYGTPVVSVYPKGEMCRGDSVTLLAEGPSEYSWMSVPQDSSLIGKEHERRVTVSPYQSSVYYLFDDLGNECMTEPATVHIEVVPYPEPQVRLSPQYVSFEKNKLELSDISPYHYSTYWRFSDGGTASGGSVIHSFKCEGIDSVWVEMESCNYLDCCSDTLFWIPVKTFSVWFPNAFIPEAETNNRFGVVASSPLDEYELRIYCRNGFLVHETRDENDQWDGTGIDGQKLPQGAYVYVYRYKGGMDIGYHTGRGTVVLIR